MNIKITDLGFAIQITDNSSLYDTFGTPGKGLFLIKIKLLTQSLPD